MATSAVAQDPSISNSDTFALYPYITSGSLTGPYSNDDVNKQYALRPTSGKSHSHNLRDHRKTHFSPGKDAGYSTDCFNRMIFTNYVPTHCYSWQDQCGAQRWNINSTYPSAGEDGQTIAGYISGLSSILIADDSSADDQGRRQLGWTSSDCGNEPKTPGFSIQSSPEQEILHVVYEDQKDGSAVFGTFYTCWVEGDIYGPRIFYRDAARATPEGCADVLLVPRCVNETSLVQNAVGQRCYQGGLPA